MHGAGLYPWVQGRVNNSAGCRVVSMGTREGEQQCMVQGRIYF